MATFQPMPALVAGQVLTAEALNRYRENAEWLLSAEAFGSPSFRVSYGGTTVTTVTNAWSGAMHHWGTTLGYSVRIANVGATPSFKVQIQIASVWTDLVSQTGLTANYTYEGTASLTGLGLTLGTAYDVRVTSVNAEVEVNRLFTTGSPRYSWQSFGATTNGTVWTTAEWGVLRNNLLYLYDQIQGAWTPTRPVTLVNITGGGLSGDAQRLPDATPWRGTFHHRSDYLAYDIGGRWNDSNSLSGAVITPSISRVTATSPTAYNTGKGVGFYYNAGALNKYGDYPPVTGNDNNNEAGSYTINGHDPSVGARHQAYLAPIGTSTDAIPATAYPLAGLTRGAWYEARLNRIDGNLELYNATLLLLYEAAGAPDLTGWATIAPFAHGDYPVGAGGKIADLVANITELRARIDGYPHLLCPYAGSLYFYRRSHVLLWKGSDVTISWLPGPWPKRDATAQTQTLGTSATLAAFDLRALSGSEPGSSYWLTERSGTDTLVAFEIEDSSV